MELLLSKLFRKVASDSTDYGLSCLRENEHAWLGSNRSLKFIVPKILAARLDFVASHWIHRYYTESIAPVQGTAKTKYGNKHLSLCIIAKPPLVQFFGTDRPRSGGLASGLPTILRNLETF